MVGGGRRLRGGYAAGGREAGGVVAESCLNPSHITLAGFREGPFPLRLPGQDEKRASCRPIREEKRAGRPEA